MISVHLCDCFNWLRECRGNKWSWRWYLLVANSSTEQSSPTQVRNSLIHLWVYAKVMEQALKSRHHRFWFEALKTRSCTLTVKRSHRRRKKERRRKKRSKERWVRLRAKGWNMEKDWKIRKVWWRERWLKGGNVMSSICHDFTLLCCDKVMNVNGIYLHKLQNASSMRETFYYLCCMLPSLPN